MAALYYGYCVLPDGTYCLAPPPPGIDASAYYNSMPAGMMPTHSASPAPPPPGTTPPPPDSAVTVPSAPTAAPALPPAPAPVAHAAPSAFYSSSSSTTQTSVSQTTSSAAAIIPPPPDIQPVIDKLAEYVARNGVKFESSVRAKNDPRFDFLQSWHQYNTYYEFKKHYFMQKEASNQPQVSLFSFGSNARPAPHRIKPFDTNKGKIGRNSPVALWNMEKKSGGRLSVCSFRTLSTTQQKHDERRKRYVCDSQLLAPS
ncbi:splicing factor, suppressor of white-apricot homolog, partial [Tachysurus ichikawai]